MQEEESKEGGGLRLNLQSEGIGRVVRKMVKSGRKQLAKKGGMREEVERYFEQLLGDQNPSLVVVHKQVSKQAYEECAIWLQLVTNGHPRKFHPFHLSLSFERARVTTPAEHEGQLKKWEEAYSIPREKVLCEKVASGRFLTAGYPEFINRL